MGSDWVPLHLRDKLPMWRVLAIGSNTLTATLLWTVVFALFNPLAERLSLSQPIRTVLLFWGSLAGFLINPLLGVISDGLTLKWGRRRIFIVIGGVSLLISMFLMMYCENIGTSINKENPLPAQRGMLIFAIVLIFAAGNIIQAPARTLCSDVCPPGQQLLMSDVVQVYGGIGGVLTNGLGALELYKYTSLSQEQFILVVCLSISAVCMVVGMLASPEEQLTEKKEFVNPFKLIWLAMKQMPPAFKRVILPGFCSPIAIYQFQVQFTAFMGGQIYGGNNAATASAEDNEKFQKGLSWALLCNVILYVAMFVWGFVNTKICDKLTMRWVYCGSMLVWGVCLVLFFFVTNKYIYIVVAIINGIVTAVTNSLPYAIVSMCIPTEEIGGNLGIVVCLNVIGQQISNFGIGQGIGTVWNYSPKHLIGISCIGAFLGAIFGFWIITPDPEELVEKNRQNAAAKQQADKKETTDEAQEPVSV
jgi:solute carrier family 45 protein 1/2/4